MSDVSPPPRLHPPEELCARFALGELSSVEALLVACHLTFCAACRRDVRLHEEAAGLLLERAEDAPVSPQALARVLGRVDAADHGHHAHLAHQADQGEPTLGDRDALLDGAASGAGREPALVAGRGLVAGDAAPASPPLADLQGLPLPRPLEHWLARQSRGAASTFKTLAPGLRSFRLREQDGGRARVPEVRARLLLFAPRFTLPLHRHAGDEHTLVLAGGFSDRGQHCGRGDVAQVGRDEWHAPRVDDDGPCLALVVDEGPAVGASLLRRWLLSFIDR